MIANVWISMSVDWEFMNAVTNVLTRKEVTVVHVPKIYFLIAMANVVCIEIFANMKTVDVVRYASFIIIIRFACVEKDLKSIEMIVHSAMILMNVFQSTSKFKAIKIL